MRVSGDGDYLSSEELLESLRVPLPTAIQETVSLELLAQPLLQVPAGSHIYGGLAVAVEQGGVGPVGQQQGADLGPGLAGGLVQGSELPQVHGVHIRPVGDQQLRHLEVAVAAGVMQGHEAALVLGVHVGPVREEELDDPGPVVAGGEVQGGGLAAVTGVAVHVEGGQQGQQLLLVTAPGRLQQLVLLIVGACT